MTRAVFAAEDKVGALTEEKTQLLQRLLEERSRQSEAIKPFARNRDSSGNRLPTSWAQQRLWFIDQLEGRSEAYHIAFTFRLRGMLDQHALRRALDAILQRHEALRTQFVNIDGDPQQEIAAPGSFPLELIDLSFHSAAERDVQIRHHRVDEVTTKFDLRSNPLIRGRLLRIGPQEHLLLITMHHIASDGWSIGVLVRELSQLYAAYCEGRDDPLQPLPIQYADYAQWQRQWLHGEALDKQLRYWRERLKGAPPQLELPTDRPRPAVQSYRGENVAVVLDAQLSAQLRVLAQRHELTLFMLLYAGWAILLSRLSGQHDVVIGTPVSNRQRPELEGLIGFFVNTLALRIEVHPELPLAALLDKAKTLTLAAYRHQDVPFEQVVEALQPERSLTRNPIFQVMLSLQSAPKGDLQMPGLTATLEEEVYESSMFDLMLSLEERGDEIVGNLNYATDLFERKTIERWIACFDALLRAMTEAVSAPVGQLPILPESEWQRVVKLFNTTETAYPRGQLVHELFEQQMERAPAALAVIYEGEALTYADLNRRANRLARYLRDQGVGPNRLVAICLDRSPEMVVSLLAILKAGGAYLPLDPNYPAERLQHMLDDAAPRVILTQRSLRAQLPVTPAHVIEVDTELPQPSASPDEHLSPPALGLSSQNLVYVIYTSGSTGRPKGTAMAHDSMVNLIEWHRQNLPSREGERVLQFAALSFDVAFQETFSTLCTGGTLVLLQEWVRRDPRALTEFLSRHRIERLFVPPMMLQSLAECSTTAGVVPSDLRDVIAAGEQLRIDAAVSGLFKELSGCRLHNHYGPTETHVVTSLTLTGDPDEWPALPAIGRPIANTQVYVLDAFLQPVPIGVTGELYIGGAAIAEGYLGQAELTSQRFVEDPFSSTPRARMYKTGDLGRWRADGMLEYSGRNDDQVKVRGFRVELGEIEAQLAKHEEVKEAAIVAREDVPGDKRLVAYFTRAGESGPSVEELRTHLKSVMPDHMLPSAFVMLERLPLTPSGKLDRRALPPPDFEAFVSGKYEAPQGDVEEILAGIWKELLRVERVGRHDNFFELGGHSLLIVQMMDRLRRLGLSAEVRRVFESPTLADLASALSNEAAGQIDVPPNLIPPGCEAITPQMLPLVELETQHIERIVQSVPGGATNIQDIYPLAPLQEGMLFHHLLNERDGDAYARPILLSLSSREKLEEFIRALQKVIDRHDALRTAVVWEELPRPIQVVYRHASLPVEELVLNHKRAPIEELKQRMFLERHRLDFRQAPLMCLQVVSDADDGQWYALLQMHHLVFDNESLHILLAEVIAYLEGRSHELPAPAAYRDHLARALAYARTHDAEAFFRSKLADIDEPTAPFGLLDVHGDGSQVESTGQALDAAVARQLRTQARRAAVSPATLFHSAWALVVSHTSGRDDVVFGSVLLGRLQGSADAQRTVGMFMNTLPLRLRLEDMTASQLIEQTQRELVELLNHEQASLAEAQRCSGIAGSAPLFSTLLNYRRGIVDRDVEFASAPGVTFLASHGRTNYPITLSVVDQEEGFGLEMETDRRIDPHRMMGYLHAAVRSLVEALEHAPQTPALALSILPESERRQVIELFNPTHASYPQEKLIHELFEAQVQRTPDAVAVMYEGRSLTYAQLNGKANQLAHYLRDRRVKPDQLVALCAERSLEMVVGLLGILKAGAAYVPLDPNYPTERLAYMLTDAAPTMLLTQERLRERLPNTASEVIALDKDWNEIAEMSTGNLDLRAVGLRSHHLAYVIYTSGSTGKPKGVMVEHRNVTRLLAATEKYFDFNERDVWTLFHSLAFDFSVWELWGALLYGGRVVVVSYLTARSPQEFYRLVCAEGVTVLNQTPSAFAQLIDAQAQSMEERHELRVVIFGGEALELRTLRPWVKRNGAQWPRLVNMYGITETTVHVTYCPLAKEEIESERGSVVGKPIGDLRAYLLDRHRQPVPIGVAGEIYVGGAGVARGYLHRPELTAQRFLPDPFSTDPQARLYKTGDLARWRADGMLEYLGRNDDQVKIRGYRIELGEIEAEVGRYAQVKDVVVLAREDVPGEKRLVAYMTTHDRSSPNVEALRTHLRAALPEYMVPSAFVTLESLPLTSNGKLDRRALPVPELESYVSRQYEPPQGEIEEALAGIWQGLLRIERVGRHDNFFELGGHSLLAIQMISRIRELLQVEMPLRALFDASTVEQLAVRLKAEEHGQSVQEKLRIDTLAWDLRQEISEMHDDAVLARIAEFEKELAQVKSGQVTRGRVEQ